MQKKKKEFVKCRGCEYLYFPMKITRHVICY